MSERLFEDTCNGWIESTLTQLKVKENDPVSAMAELEGDSFLAGWVDLIREAIF